MTKVFADIDIIIIPYQHILRVQSASPFTKIQIF